MQPPPTSKPHSREEAGGDRDLFGAILASVSRSFYLTIRVLPAPVRRPIALAYLLARTSDTIADSAGIPAAERLEVLREFGRAIANGTGAQVVSRLDAFQSQVEDPAERTLLSHADTLLALLRAADPGDRAEVVRVLEVILRGQEHDLERFSTRRGEGVSALSNAQELDDYTYRVAGCVGEFWTRICFRHLPGYATRDEEEMIRLGIGFGKGLQLVNILRDAPADLASGRCYLPADELAGEGISPEMLLAEPDRVRPVVDRWLAQAREHLAEGFRYLEAVRPWRLRLACFLPWAIGVKTVALMARKPPLESAERVKISRKEVRRLLSWGLLVAMGNFFLKWFKNRNR